MEQRPAPEVTIEGGPGWQLGVPPEPVEADVESPSAPAQPDRTGRRSIGTLVLAAALGFAAATAVAETRRVTLAESDDGVLSLEVQRDDMGYDGGLVTDGDGRPALVATVTVRNTGPRPVALEAAELVGTPYRTQDLRGRRVGEGGQTVLPLLRPLDCTSPDLPGPPGPLRVTATTGTGTQSVDLRMDSGQLGFHSDQVRGACGLWGPGAAVVVMDQTPLREGDRLRITTTLSNASARPVLLTAIEPQEGLRTVELLDRSGQPLVLPLGLPPGDYDPPVDPYAGRGDERTVVVLLEVQDCARLPRVGPDHYLPLLRGRLSSLQGEPATTEWGGDPQPLTRLRDDVCGGDAATVLGSAGPSLAEVSEQALHTLRRDHPFLTPD